MAKISYTLVHNRKKSLLQDGTAAITICAYLNGKRRYFSTNIKIKPEQWDKKRSKIKSNTTNYQQKNDFLAGCIEELEREEMELVDRGMYPLLDDLTDFKTEKIDKTDFLAFFNSLITRKLDVTYTTLQVYIFPLIAISQKK